MMTPETNEVDDLDRRCLFEDGIEVTGESPHMRQQTISANWQPFRPMDVSGL